MAVANYDAGTAFEAKDYDRFVSMSEQVVKNNPNSAEAIAMLSSALACKYAVTGDSIYRERAEDLLMQADKLSRSTAEERNGFQEYSERIRYRLVSREIIDTDEYNRRFRSGKTKKD
jgi:hypothetical protein